MEDKKNRIFAPESNLFNKISMNIPEAFRQQMSQILGPDTCQTFLNALEDRSSTSLRINYQKSILTSDSPTVKTYLPFSNMSPVPWATSSEGFYLAERPSFTMDPHFHAGKYYVQEASSMLVGALLSPLLKTPVIALDLCAAPGGKSTDLLSTLPQGSILLSNEVIRSRAQILKENIIKWGNPNHIVTNNDPAEFKPLKETFDVIVTDVPCSGEGMFRKDINATSEWSPEHVDLCVQRQQRIVSDIWGSLRPGGLLVYSTCTYNLKENEQMVQWIADNLGATPIASPTKLDEAWGVLGSLSKEYPNIPVYRCMPHKIKGEGFFCAILQKSDKASDVDRGISTKIMQNPLLSNSEITPQTKKKHKLKKQDKKRGISGQETVDIPWINWLNPSDRWDSQWFQEALYVYDKRMTPIVNAVQPHLRILDMGIAVASIKGKNYIPHHALAMSVHLRTNAFPVANIDYTQAIAYLRREAIVLTDQPKGFVLICYNNIPLGFVKNIGNRANNLYPNEWRIRKQV